MKDCMLTYDVIDIIYYKLHNLYMKDIVHEINCKIFKYEHKSKLTTFILYHDIKLHLQLKHCNNIIKYNNILCEINNIFYHQLNTKLQYVTYVLNSYSFWLFDDELYRFKVGHNVIKKHIIKHNKYSIEKKTYTIDDINRWYIQIMNGAFKYVA